MCVFKNHAFIYFLRPPSWSGTVLLTWIHILSGGVINSLNKHVKNNRTTLTGKSQERRERHIRENMYCTPPQTWKYVLYTAPNVKICTVHRPKRENMYCTVHRPRRIREFLKKFTQYAADATWFVWKFSRLIRSHQPLLEILGIFLFSTYRDWKKTI